MDVHLAMLGVAWADHPDDTGDEHAREEPTQDLHDDLARSEVGVVPAARARTSHILSVLPVTRGRATPVP